MRSGVDAMRMPSKCRAVEGAVCVTTGRNFPLEDDQVAAGFVLKCQSRLETAELDGRLRPITG
jgi:hypothetical protein